MTYTICLNCKAETTNPKYCSKSCSATHTNKLYPKRKVVRICNREDCKEQIKSHRHSLCEKHTEEYQQNKYRHRSLGEYKNKESVLNKHPSWITTHIRQFNRSWNKDLTQLPCAHCNYDKHVELCHIKPVSSFSDDAILDDINSPSNVIQLCPNCHWEFDNLPREKD